MINLLKVYLLIELYDLNTVLPRHPKQKKKSSDMPRINSTNCLHRVKKEDEDADDTNSLQEEVIYHFSSMYSR